MKRIGAFVGKFLPPHIGHVAQMEKCAEMVDELHIVVSENPEKTAKLCESSGLDPIPGKLRVEWLAKHFENNPKVKVFYVNNCRKCVDKVVKNPITFFHNFFCEKHPKNVTL